MMIVVVVVVVVVYDDDNDVFFKRRLTLYFNQTEVTFWQMRHSVYYFFLANKVRIICHCNHIT